MGKDRSSKRSGGDTGRDSGPFIAFPWSVIDSASYALLSHPARGLLFEVARQYVRDNNGRLLLSSAYLKKRGWKSADVISRAKKELLESGFIFETVKGHRPNKASWYAITWYSLDPHPDYDAGVTSAFQRGQYRHVLTTKNTGLIPSRGIAGKPIAPSDGLKGSCVAPSGGTNKRILGAAPIPSHGHHLEMPSAGKRSDPLASRTEIPS
jgi:hypothetical protein